MDLVFTVPDPYIESMRAEGSRVVLLRRKSVRESAGELASALRGKELVSARALDEEHLEAQFADADTATKVAQYGALGFDLGPFQVDTIQDGRIRLVRRSGGGVDAIELIESTRADEWRRLMAHELDVVPETASLYRSEFKGLSSIRALETQATDTTAIYFNVQAPALADVATRRRIAGAIHRPAMARLVCGDPACASPSVDGTAEGVLPPRLVLLVLQDDTTLRTAAKILSYQLWPLGVELIVEAVPASEIVQRMTAGQFDLAMFPLSLADHRFGFFLSPGHPKGLPITGFANSEYDAAVERGDLATAQAILDREVPVTRLYENRYFASVDGRFCGDVKPTGGSWLWLSKLYPCDQEAPPP
jgi:hypothetical protein